MSIKDVIKRIRKKKVAEIKSVEEKEVVKEVEEVEEVIEPTITPEERRAREQKYDEEMLRQILDTRNEGVYYPIQKDTIDFV